MAPRSHNSNSESESRGRSNNNTGQSHGASTNNARASGKQRLTVAQQQYLKELLRRHIDNNHPDNEEQTHPADFESYSDEFLRKYKDHYSLNAEDNLSLSGYLLGSELGGKTYSSRRNQHGVPGARITKKELASQVKRHFTSSSVKETECIPTFIYKVKNRKRKFKMEFQDQ
ncbi:LAMI_0A05204g1_1 [Lachancea mirantina]|uniref:LAMI_0A05204g1_1 n=1 Tax=Lachancea mirantina TaxID=1230905 RepID=A0A1G4IPE8_9SACH|nr:LAMI_0A05204g1_1 [Lachancea mirantina]